MCQVHNDHHHRGHIDSTGPVDQSAAAAIRELPSSGPITGEQTARMIRRGTEDTDGQAAGLEHTDIMAWARQNWDRLSPEAKQMIELYDKTCLAVLASGKTGIETPAWNKMMADIDALVGKDQPHDASADAAIAELVASYGPISGERMKAAIETGAGDLDGQAAGVEFAAFMKFASENRARLSPEARKVLDIYERYARQAQSTGQTGITQNNWTKMMAEMQAAHTYNDASAGVELDALDKKGIVSGKDLMTAIDRGTRDLDGQAAGLEFADFEKWAHDNAARLGGSAKDVLAIYEKYARHAQSEGRTGLTPDEHAKMLGEMRGVVDAANRPDHHRISLGEVIGALVDAEAAAEEEIDSGLAVTKDPGKKPPKAGETQAEARARQDSELAAAKQADAMALANKFALQQKLDNAIETAVSNATKNEADMWTSAARGI
jgi:hypothetical protein